MFIYIVTKTVQNIIENYSIIWTTKYIKCLEINSTGNVWDPCKAYYETLLKAKKPHLNKWRTKSCLMGRLGMRNIFTKLFINSLWVQSIPSMVLHLCLGKTILKIIGIEKNQPSHKHFWRIVIENHLHQSMNESKIYRS